MNVPHQVSVERECWIDHDLWQAIKVGPFYRDNNMLTNEFIPAKEVGSKRLFILLHGLGDSIEGFRWLPDALGIPWLNFLLVNAPDRYYTGFSWYDLGDVPSGLSKSGALLVDLLEQQEGRGFTADNTFLGGFSQGCLMSVEVGLRYPRKFGGIIGVSGYLCDPDKLVRELSPLARLQRILMTHGNSDPLVPVHGVRAQVKQLIKAGLNVEWHELNKGHAIAGEPELKIIREFIARGVCSVKPI